MEKCANCTTGEAPPSTLTRDIIDSNKLIFSILGAPTRYQAGGFFRVQSDGRNLCKFLDAYGMKRHDDNTGGDDGCVSIFFGDFRVLVTYLLRFL